MNEETLVLIRAFFASHPQCLPAILTYPDDLIVWEAFFAFVFNEEPCDTEIVQPPLIRRHGSADPRWDELLHNRQALKAMKHFVEEHYISSESNNIQPTKEAA